MMNLNYVKKLFINILIGSLIIASLLAVIVVILGSFDDIMARAIGTIGVVALHALIIFLFARKIDSGDNSKDLNLFINTFFVLVIVSFLTAVFAIWQVIPEDIIADFYLCYFVVIFSVLHINVLSKALHKKKYIDRLVYSNYVFVAIVAILLFPPILQIEASFLNDMYYRILAAAGIIDGTLSILTFIFYKLYIKENPPIKNEDNKHSKRKISILVWLIIAYLIFKLIQMLFDLII